MPPKKQKGKTPAEQEWSYFFDVNKMDGDKEEICIEADEDQRADLAKRLGVVSVKDAFADLSVTYLKSNATYHVEGDIEATVIQECIVTLEPIETAISESIEGWYADKQSAVSFAAAKREREGARSQGEVEILTEEDDPEPLLNGHIDLGELATQHISLAIPLYPQKEGAEYAESAGEFSLDDESPLRKNPFEALKDWKEKR